MASLQGQQINNTYEGLIKTADNTSTPPFPPAKLQYGDGTELPISLGDGTSVGVGQITLIEGTPGVAGGGFLEVNGVGVNIGKLANIDNNGASSNIWNGTFNFGQGFPGAPSTTVDFTNATVTGLPGGAAGLESGTGTDSMQSAASLTTNAADANGNDSIALGDNASANLNSVAIGLDAQSTSSGGNNVAIGKNAEANGAGGGKVAVGLNATASGDNSVAVGNSDATGSNSVSLGIVANATNTYSLAMGRSVTSSGQSAIAAGYNSNASADNSIAIGDAVNSAGIDTTAIGKTISTVTNSLNSVLVGTDLSTGSTGSDGTVVIGHGNQTSDGRTVAIGYDVDIPSGQGQAIGNDINITGADRSTAIGSGINIDTVGSDKIGIGTTMSLTADRAIGIGRDVTVSGDRAIAIGDSTTAGQDGSITIGDGATANTTGDAQVVIGKNARADHEKTVAIGENAQGHFQAVAIGRNSKAGTTSNKGGCIAIGNTSNADTQDDAVAIGTSSSAQARGAVALGRTVSATIEDTVSVKALEVQTDSTPTAGGIIISDAGGTDRRLNIDASGALQIDSTPVGGGGSQVAYSAAVPSGMDGVIPYGSVGGGNYRTTRVITSASLADAYNPGTDSAYYELIAMQEGTTLSELIIEVATAGGAGSTAEIALYDTGISSGEVDGGSKLLSLGTVDISTTGQKVVTLGTPFTMPAGKTNGQIMIVVWPSDHNVRFEGWSNSVGGPGLKRFGTTWYFTKSTFIKPGVTPGTTLPASLSGVERWAAVQRPIAIWYK